MECEMCGSREAVTKAKIEGVVLHVCERCAKYGKEIKAGRETGCRKIPVSEELPVREEIPVEDFGKEVKKLREKSKLSQEELAKEIGEKTSVIRRIEEGWVPEEKVIRKLEKFFGVKLMERISECRASTQSSKNQALTLGDVAEIKM